jgi:capsular exopolysaccharide synthesis family protein
MSRIFDALSRTDGGYEDILQPIREQAAGTAAILNAPIPGENRGLMDAPPVEISAKEEAPDIRYYAPAAPPLPESRPAVSRLPADFKTFSLRIPLSVPALPFDGVHDDASEEYRMIRTRILHHPSQPKVFLVSSPCPGDGKTITTINIAGALALRGNAEVLVIEADFARSAFSGITGIPQSPGLGEVLTGESLLEDAVVRTAQFPHLHILTAGRSTANPAELLDSEAWTKLLETLRQRFSYIVFDSPPVEAVPYYGRLLAACDGIILVARPDHTGRQELNDALMGTPEAKLLGVVLNCHSRWFLNNKDYRSYSRYYSKPRE